MKIQKKTFNSYFIFFIGIAFFYGILSFQHYAPSVHDFYINSIVFFICSVGTFFCLLKKKYLEIKINQFLWLFCLGVFIIQPFINYITYIDGLIFPIAQFLLVLIISIVVSNLNDNKKFIESLAIILSITSFFLLLTQFSHVFKIHYFVDLMRIPLQNQRFSGNLFQPNQTAFVFVLGVISLIFLSEKINSYLKYFLIFLMSIGVYFTASRSGLLMLIIFSLILNIYINYSESKKIFIVKDFLCIIGGVIIGVFSYAYFTNGIDTLNRASLSNEDPRLAFLKQAELIFLEHPITGVGWKNFASTGLDYYERVGYLSTTDHTHFIFTQLISEFGLLGLLVIIIFFFVLIKNIFFIKDKYDFYVFSVLLIFIVYSCFEYPLWYFRYLMIFSIFFSLFDKTSKSYYRIDKGYLISIVSFLLSVFSIYYIYQYNKVAYVNDIVFSETQKDSSKFNAISSMDSVFGFTYYKDLFLYQTISIDGFLLDDSIVIGERLVNYVPLPEYLMKQGALMGLDGQQIKSYNYFKAACYYQSGRKCQVAEQYLNSLAKQYPEYFQVIYLELIKNNHIQKKN